MPCLNTVPPRPGQKPAAAAQPRKEKHLGRDGRLEDGVAGSILKGRVGFALQRVDGLVAGGAHLGYAARLHVRRLTLGRLAGRLSSHATRPAPKQAREEAGRLLDSVQQQAKAHGVGQRQGRRNQKDVHDVGLKAVARCGGEQT